MDLSHDPRVLYQASIERIVTARRLVDEKPENYVMAMYLAGLAVESILQAIALRERAPHDARHGLPSWLAKCPPTLNDALKGSDDWNIVVAMWDNSLRYLSFDGLLGRLRAAGSVRGIKGGPASVVRRNALYLIDSAETVHKKGLAQWFSARK